MKKTFIMNRTGINFEKHIVEIVKQDGLLIHHLRISNTVVNNIKYINTNGIMAVTGDFGNWIFCREFHPSADGHVSDGYWGEKLEILSTQKYKEYNSEETLKELELLLIEDGGEKYTEQEIDYLNECIYYVEDEIEYKYHAFRHNTGRFYYENIPYVETNHHWLNYIFDGFDEICRRYKEGLIIE